MRTIFLISLFLATGFLLTAQTNSASSVFFELDKYELSPEARQTLDRLAAGLLEAPDYTVSIDAYTDNQGTEQYNLQLATDRAQAVQQYLAAKGLLPGKTNIKSWGERNLSYNNTSEESRRKNRRVDIAATYFTFSDVAALQKHLAKKDEQTMIVQPDREEQITAAGGTVIVIPPQSFVFEDGSSPTGPVEITVKEAYSPADWIAQNLSTTSNGQLLQTGGMVYIDARAEGKTLALADGAALTVAIPAKRVDPGMELFYSRHDSTGNVNWQPVGQTFRQTMKDPEVRLDIDPALGRKIMSMKAPLYPKPTAPVFADNMRPVPRRPNAPRPPYPPQKPDRDDIRRMFGAGGGMSMSRKSSKKADQYYREAMKKYDRDSADYVVLYKKYEAKVENYKAANQRFYTEVEKWEEEVKGRIMRIMDFEREQYLCTYSNSLQKALLQVGKNAGKFEYYSNLEGAIHNATAANLKLHLKEEFLSQNRDRVIISDLYYKSIGHKVVDGPEFRGLYHRVKDLYPPDTLERATAGILKSIGFKQISDSLKTELKEKRLLAARSPEQAGRFLNAYVADVSRMGWINCDKFYKDPAERVQLVVNEPESATMYIICKDINSILSCTPSGQGTYAATGIPKGKKVSVVSIKLKDGKAQLATRDVKAGEAGALDMTYRSLSIKELREELRNL